MKILFESDFDKIYEELSELGNDLAYTKDNVQNTVRAVPGIYLIYRKADDGRFHKYVGQAVNLRARLLKHLSRAAYIKENPKTEANAKNSVYKDSPALHSAMCRHNDFYFKILKICPVSELNNAEQEAIKDYGTYKNKWDYNLTEGGQSGTITHSTGVEQWEISITRQLGQGGKDTINWIKCINTYKSESAASRAISGEDKHQGISKALFDSTGNAKVHKDPNIQWAGFGWRLVDPAEITETDEE